MRAALRAAGLRLTSAGAQACSSKRPEQAGSFSDASGRSTGSEHGRRTAGFGRQVRTQAGFGQQVFGSASGRSTSLHFAASGRSRSRSSAHRSSHGRSERGNAWHGTWPEHTCRKPGRTSSRSAAIAGNRASFIAQQGNSEHRDTHRDAQQIRAIHSSNLQLKRYRSVKKLTLVPSLVSTPLDLDGRRSRRTSSQPSLCPAPATQSADSLPCSSFNGCIRW